MTSVTWDSTQQSKNAHNRAEKHNWAQCTQPSVHKQMVFTLAKQVFLLLFTIDQVIWKTLWGLSYTANCAFKSDMGCRSDICLKKQPFVPPFMTDKFPKMVAHNWASVPGCVLRDARLCADRIGCVEVHPCKWWPDSERRRYIVTSSPIGWAHTQNNPCIFRHIFCEFKYFIVLAISIMVIAKSHCGWRG